MVDLKSLFPVVRQNAEISVSFTTSLVNLATSHFQGFIMKENKPRYRLALDMGSNSIGWVLVTLDENDWPQKIEKAGVRIFSNSRGPKSIPLSVDRRTARGARKRRDRNLLRKNTLLKELRCYGLCPVTDESKREFTSLDPYALRYEGLSRKLSDLELSRVLLHLTQRRGFLSNRKNIAKDEGGESLSGKISDLKSDIEASGSHTLGAFLFLERHSRGLPTRMRSDSHWYPTRSLYVEELKTLRQVQAPHFPNLSPETWSRFEQILFFQRPLKKQQPGRCRFEPELERGYRALPSYQRFRMLQQIANLKLIEPGKRAIPLSIEERRTLLDKLTLKDKLSYDDARKLLGKPDISFNLEIGRNSFRASKHLFGDRSSHLLSGKKYFGAQWKFLTEEDQNSVIELILDEENETTLRKHLATQFVLEDEQIENIVSLSEENFEPGYAEFSKQVLQRLSKCLFENPEFTYDQAVAKLGYHHSDFRPDKLLSELPYYGAALPQSVKDTPDSKVEEERKFGKISNPTVHVALNQLRKIINALMRKYGTFDQIVVEVARDLPLGERGLKQLANENRANEKRNDAWAEKLQELGFPNNYKNRLRLRLWEELGTNPTERRCPYSGEMINIAKLFSSEIEIDHILPQSRTFTNHHSNLILCIKQANQLKREKSPFEAFGGKDSPYPYSEILSRVTHLPLHKQPKFAPDAMEQFEDQGAFLERQLNDTRFISKATAQYLQHVCRRVMVSRGRLTAYLRSEINLNRLLSSDGRKNRNDHRHHAIDAFLVGLSTPKSLRALDRILHSQESPGDRTPLSELIKDFSLHIDGMIVSHRVDHSPDTKFFEETAYSKFNQDDGYLVIRKAIAEISDPENVVDPRIRAFMVSHSLKKDELAQAVFDKFGAKKVKTLKKDASAVQIRHPKDDPRFEKWLIPLDICRLEFWRMPGDSATNKLFVVSYTSQEVSIQEQDKKRANPALRVEKKPHPAAKKVFTIHKGDALRLTGVGNVERTVVVESLRLANEVILFTDHNIGKNENAVGRTVRFSQFANKKLRIVHVNELGEVKDPGPWWLDDFKSSRNSKSGMFPERLTRTPHNQPRQGESR